MIAQHSWFRGAGLGVFIHWDHASQQGVEISWPIVGWPIRPGRDDAGETMSAEQYYSSAATFNPTEWDAAAVAAEIADAGATYAVFTAKHHGGYTMWPSAYSDFGVQNGPYDGDLFGDLAQQLHARGVRVGVYLSLPDWHDPDYPAFLETDRPYPQDWAQGMKDAGGRDRYRRPSEEQWQRFRGRLKGQISELLSNYGEISIIWFDGEWERTIDEWRAGELRELIISLQPEILINDRLPGHGDYETPEQGMPRHTPIDPWELNITMGDMWAYRPEDERYAKSARSLVARLCEVASRGGTLLLNVAPTGTGALQPYQVERLRQIGSWMQVHRDAIVGASPAPDVDFYGPVTQSASSIFLHLVSLPVEEVVARGVPVDRIESVTLVSTGEALNFRTNLEVHTPAAPGEERLGEILVTAPARSGAIVDVIKLSLSAAV